MDGSFDLSRKYLQSLTVQMLDYIENELDNHHFLVLIVFRIIYVDLWFMIYFPICNFFPSDSTL